MPDTRTLKKPSAPADTEIIGQLASLFENSPAYIALVVGPDYEVRAANALLRRMIGREDVTGRPLREIISIETNVHLIGVIDQVYRTGTPFVAEEVRLELPGESSKPLEYFVNVALQPLFARDGSVRGVLGNGVDVTAQVRARRQAAEIARRARRQLDRFRAIFASLEEAVILVQLDTRKITMNAAALRLYGFQNNIEANHFLGHIQDLFRVSSFAGTVIPLEEWPILRALRGERYSDYEVHAMRRDGTRNWYGSYCATPVSIDGGEPSVSVITVRDVTVQRQLEREIVRAGEDERRRIGQELHDGLGSHLTGTAMLLSALTNNVREGRPLNPDSLHEVVLYLKQAADQARSLAHGLSPMALQGKGLSESLRKLATSATSRHQLRCRIEVDDNIVELGDEVATHLYRIAQEAINNCIVHSGGTLLSLSLRSYGTSLELSIADDGVGVPEPLPESGGMGLQTMRHRAKLIGASLEVCRRERGGTLVRCILPLPG